ncbi:unnamed protein product [Rotaria magnacalcarata]|uniref:Uncharacterized protein n=2 Tax=Rotaria magnacalcarata TaxID=392030 RepID=A0A816SE13_9BILA|nr:unnamed protein product [Rotaria magnacalcarata]
MNILWYCCRRIPRSMSINIIARPQQIVWMTQRYSSALVNDLFKKEFNHICNILEQYNLINISIANEEKKEKAFQSCIPIFEHIRKAALHDNIYNYIEQILSTLGIDIHGKDEFENIFKSIMEEIQKLKLCVDASAIRTEEQEKTINNLQKRLGNLESQWLLRDIEMDAYEVVRLFQFYYVNKVIREKAPYLKEWSCLIKEWSKVETEVIRLLKLDKQNVFTDQVQNHSMVVQLLDPIEQELKERTNATIKLIDLRKIVSDRHESAHHNLRTIADQRTLIHKCEQATFPDDYPYKIILNQMVDCFKKLDSGDQTMLRPFY